MTSYRIPFLIAASALIFAGSAQAQQTPPQAGSIAKTEATEPAVKTELVSPKTPATTGTSVSVPAEKSEKPVQAPVTTTTRVEIHNQPPANQPADIHIQMPVVDMQAPKVTKPADINLQLSAPVTHDQGRDTVTEHTTILTKQPASNDNFIYIMIFGIMAILAVVGIMVGLSMRRTLDTPL